MKRSFLFLRRALFAVAFSALFISCSDIWSEQHPGTYYVFQGQTVADFLVQDTAQRFDSFLKVLKKARVYGELETYGTYTCFAPTDEAFEKYLESRNISSVDSLSFEDCDTIARTHLINTTLFLTDQTEGGLPSVNRLNRFLVLGYREDTLENGIIKPRPMINRECAVIFADDTVQNGVVHVIDNVIKVSGDYIYDIVKDNPKVSLFFSALNLVCLEDSLQVWHDTAYSVSDEMVEGITRQGGGSDYTIRYIPERNYGFTVLAETDDVYREHGINTLQDLIDHANKVYHESYESEYAAIGNMYDTIWSDDRCPLRRFVRYHILPFSIPSIINFNCRDDIIKAKVVTSLLDAEDYYETYLPHSIMRFSRILETGPYNGVYINRRGVGPDGLGEIGRDFYRGIKISEVEAETKNEGCNGYMFYIDDILEYSDFIRNNILDRRMRIDCCTLSPDFLTSGARQKKTENNYEGVGFLQPTNFHSFNQDYCMWVRSAFVANISYQGDGVDLQGNYDIMLKLPPVPHDGTWELRLSYRGSAGCGVVQNYVGDDPLMLMPCGIPTDLRYSAAENPNIRWKSDDDFDGDSIAIDAYDKAMHNRGYMKGPDSHYTGDMNSDGQTFRNYNGGLIARRIITTDYFRADKTYYLRMRLVLENPNAEMNFDYMEWCPKSIFAYMEDKH
ncbi:MAG: fasciclin domain-containing protein [Bacteroidaceae bacterium]|nr:fasciclin domain-containing protein [Bacteroidaceae bacterium]